VGYTAKLLVPEISALNFVVTENMKKYKESFIDENLVEMIAAGNNSVCSETHKLFNFE
jgi:hypothetical protein